MSVLLTGAGPILRTSLPYLCFTANTAGSTVTLGKTGSPSWTGEYSTNRRNWTTYTPGTTGAITLTNVGDSVYFRGDITANSTYNDYLQFSMTGSISASGNVNSMYTSEDFEELEILIYQYCYIYLFKNCTSLTTAPELPATTLVNSCYYEMFRNCTSLITAPALPATTLANGCYKSMFEGCTSLITAPALPATTLTNYCYYNMFYGCSNLTTAPALPATTLPSDCYGYMFCSCTNLQVYSSSGSGHTAAWRIPTSGSASSYTSQSSMFRGTTGDYSSASSVTLNTTFYTQNTPVS